MRKILLSLFALCFAVFPSVIVAQSSGRDAAIKAFETKDYGQAVPLLKDCVKANAKDAECWADLGVSYINLGKLKDAKNAVQKAVEVEPKQSAYWSLYALVLMAADDLKKAEEAIAKAAELSPPSSEIEYVRANIAFKKGDNERALSVADAAIARDPKYAELYRLRSQALLGSLQSSFDPVTGMSTGENAPKIRETMVSASNAASKYLELMPASAIDDREKKAVDDLKFFADHYGSPHAFDKDGSGMTPLKITSKPAPRYTTRAREDRVSGKIRVLAAFGANGKVGPIILLSHLPDGLDEAALKAASEIKFTPQAKDGQPMDSVRVIEYSFRVG